MRERIEGDVKRLFKSFVNVLENEHNKFIKIQENTERERLQNVANEKNRKSHHEQLSDNLRISEQKNIEIEQNYKDKIKDLEKETDKYKSLISQAQRDNKQNKYNLEESQRLKEFDSEQLIKNKNIENTFNDKIKFLSEDIANSEKRKRELNDTKKETEAGQRALKKNQLKLAEDTIALTEREDKVKIGEQRLRLKQGGIDA